MPELLDGHPGARRLPGPRAGEVGAHHSALPFTGAGHDASRYSRAYVPEWHDVKLALLDETVPALLEHGEQR